MSEQFVVALPWQLPTTNSRLHWAVRARVTKAVRQHVAVAARSERNRLRVPDADGPRRLDLMLVRGYRQRFLDRDQLYAALKPVVDGLRDAGWIKDDRPTMLLYNAEQMKAQGVQRVTVTVGAVAATMLPR